MPGTPERSTPTTTPHLDPDATISPLAVEAHRTLGVFAPTMAAAGASSSSASTISGDSTKAASGEAPVGVTSSLDDLDPSSSLLRLPRLRIGTTGTPADIEIRGHLGKGGMGVVDVGHQAPLGRDVAIKRVRPDRYCNASVRALLDEARFTGSLEHPNIVPVHLLGQNDSGEPLLVMKRIEGVRWYDLIHNAEHPAWRGVKADRLARHLEILGHICNAVHFAHSRGVIHRDLKSENVMVGGFGEVYVLDWGLAFLLGSPPSRELAGTPACMAPEMLDGSMNVSVRTDVYLLGAMLHEILTGERRHLGDTLDEVLAAVRLSKPFPYDASLPGELVAICNRACAADPEARFDSSIAFKDAIDEFLRHRDSITLTAEGDAELMKLRDGMEELTAWRASPVPTAAQAASPDSLIARLRRHSAEADFGYRQALRLWHDNKAAQASLEECRCLTIALELDQRNAAGAEALVGLLSDKPPELVARLDALKERLRAEVAAKEKLDRMEHEADARVSLRQRTVTMISLHVLLAIFWCALALRGVAVSKTGAAAFCLMLTVSFAGAVWWRRETLLANSYNRSFVLCFLVLMTSLVVMTCYHVYTALPVEHLTELCFVITAAIFAIMGVTIWPWAFGVVVTTLTSAVVCALGQIVLSLSVFNALLALVWAAYYWQRRRTLAAKTLAVA